MFQQSELVAVSVVVAVYNVEQFLEKCLRTLAEQTLASLEILVVNDGSPDGSQKIIDRFEREYPGRVRGLKKENGGLSDARNFGIERARGEYIGFVDGDDSVHLEMYEALLSKAREQDSDIVVCGYEGVDMVTGSETYHMQGLPSDYGLSLSEDPDSLLVAAPYAWNKIYRRKLFVESGVRYPKGKLFEDIPVTYSLFALANRIEKVQRPLYFYLQKRDGAITHTYSPRNLEMFDTLSMLLDFYKRNELFQKYETQLLWLNFRHIFNRFRELPSYEGLAIKRKFIAQGWEHLDLHFPGWRKHPELVEKYAGNLRFMSFVNPAWGYAYSLAPPILHQASEATSTKLKKSRRDFQRTVGAWLKRRPYTRALNSLPVEPGVALFESFHGKNISDYPFYLLREMSRRGGFRLFVATTDVEQSTEYLKTYEIDATPVLVQSAVYQRVLATAGILVNNVSFPPYFVKRAQQTYLNTWHGTPLKTLGKAMPFGLKDLPNIQRNFLKADLLYFTNRFTRDVMMRDYMLESVYAGRELTMGSARNVAFFDEARRSQLRRELGLEGTRVYLYMPTWRGGNSRRMDINAYREQVLGHLATLNECIDEGAVLLVKFHSLVARVVSAETLTRVKPAPEKYETYDLLNVADCLVTDYSSVLFDFAVTRREILLFNYDLPQYEATRGFYFPYDDVPFPKFCTARELADHIGASSVFQPNEKYERFVERYCPHDSSDAAEMLTDRLLFETKDKKPIGPEVDLVFLTGLSEKSGQERLVELLDDGYCRSDVVFAFSLGNKPQLVNEFLREIERERGVELRYVVLTNDGYLTEAQLVGRFLKRGFDWDTSLNDTALDIELQRLFGGLNVRCAIAASNHRRFTELASRLGSG